MAISMREVTSSELRHAVERQPGGVARFVGVEPVSETSEGRPVWQDLVHVFDLAGHPTATRAYAWSSPIEGSTMRRFYAVPHVPPISSPVDAVRAAIVEEYRRGAL